MQRLPVVGIVVSCAAVIALNGCGTTPAVTPAPADPPLALTTNVHVPTGEKADHLIARDDGDIVLQLDIYQLTVPFGAVSRDSRFWQHVDEDHVDLATHALLLSNGLRYGIGPNNEWDFFKGLIDHYGATAQKGCVAPARRGALELPMRENIASEDIFYFKEREGTGRGLNAYGRSYEKCDNLFALSFEPTPRHPGDARIAICAMVRGLRRQFEVTVLNEVREIEFKNPEYLYDLRLRQDVPMDHFLILAPSPAAELPHSLGHTFLVRPGGAEPMETVLLLVPRPFRLSGEVPNVPLNRVAPTPAKPTDGKPGIH